MSLTYAQFKAAIAHSVVRVEKTSLGVAVPGRLWSRWRQNPFTASGPTSPIALTSASSGAANRGSPVFPAWIRSARLGHVSAPILVVDRLSQMGGLSGTVITTQTTNLPTAALTRYTNGSGVLALLEQDSPVGSTAATISVSYTNSAGVAGRTSPNVSFGGTNDRGAAMSTLIPLQVGDVGIRSVESATLNSTTGSVGDFGIALVKPLAIVHSWDECHSWAYDAVKDMGAWFEPIQSNACIAFYAMSPSTTGETLSMSGSLELIQQV